MDPMTFAITKQLVCEKLEDMKKKDINLVCVLEWDELEKRRREIEEREDDVF